MRVPLSTHHMMTYWFEKIAKFKYNFNSLSLCLKLQALGELVCPSIWQSIHNCPDFYTHWNYLRYSVIT